VTAVAVRGVGTSTFGRFPGTRPETLAWAAVAEAMRDADTSPSDIDAVYVGTVFGPPGIAARVVRSLGIHNAPIVTIEAACASGTAAYHEAVAAIVSERFGTVLAFGIEHLSSMFTAGAIIPEATDAEGAADLALPALYALQANRYIHLHGATPEAIAQVAVKNKYHGSLNPRAHLAGGTPTLDEVMASKLIADPLTLLQCCPSSDGAAAAVIGPARRIGADVEVLASVALSGGRWEGGSDDFFGVRSIGLAADRAFAEAGVGREVVDVLEVHDAFTIGEILTLEALGLCKPGEGADLAVTGHTSLGGAQPVNVSGGLLARGHPLGATGLAQIAEIVWQLRGDAGPRQVPRARIGLVETAGGGAAGVDVNNIVVTLLGRT